ncbi:hypothetical protein COU62_03175 [Candidatus Pacearchaeota archaeon CG10_big_fil_rev_8_21_14_0_10_35_219]|nr:MAG: hypothetical protein COU62_03175 [Candidatus Pacearchaeota archaeon CG10_big_fil_rev_8_21_14_0_10_35_219]PIY81138.1 MAG: hypothetical protein COY79_04215 [Candidatus Pacearchaeota archaeon CG_4_10_14_0_8_um_filter_35_169]PIZ79735.1 MAG: hypothetical protein COY00_03575 [Candidatus Pacearchaeota archaeon CG_4_10_14_0_2_um_filter_35_33]PJA70332.1 MAG: hypothetical protein CO155_00620 [Candidatus Pacearchaeota archaeon CG_4_9_14_3_um_filter_35_19]PJB93754.1 MAG: hypothetical protein CO081_
MIILSAFFSGIETALMSVSRIKANALLKQVKKGSDALHRLKQNPHRLIMSRLPENPKVQTNLTL